MKTACLMSKNNQSINRCYYCW